MNGYPRKRGLYDPGYEHDSCGVGFVCRIDGCKEHAVVKKAGEVLKRMSHRGAVGSDPKTGDGAGMLLQLPHEFFVKEASKSGIDLPKPGEYGAGIVFLPKQEDRRREIARLVDKTVNKHGQNVLWRRRVPIDATSLGRSARKSLPHVEQIFISKSDNKLSQDAFERKLYVIRKSLERTVRGTASVSGSGFHVTGLSSRTIIYKGLLMPEQLEELFPDLRDAEMKSALAIVHSRYSTNTFPAWDLAQPFRYLAHNGEINTLRGNINSMRAKESLLESELFSKEELECIKPVITPDVSDSAMIDNVFELLLLSGRSLPESMALLIPPAWEKNPFMEPALREYRRFNSCLMEPWDGPAAIAFTDGTRIGAVLDRNGLRPARYIITKDGYVVMASEAGVQDIAASNMLRSGRLEPGKMFFIDTEEKCLIGEERIEDELLSGLECASWLSRNVVKLENISQAEQASAIPSEKEMAKLTRVFGYTREDLDRIMAYMCENGYEPTGAMGNDTPHAVLSQKPQLVFNYFKQLFAQVTNPAIDPIREELVMCLETIIGPRGNLLAKTQKDLPLLQARHPVLAPESLAKLRGFKKKGYQTRTIPILFNASGDNDMRSALEDVAARCARAAEEGCHYVILTDRGTDGQKAAIPSLLAVGRVHQYLLEKSLRSRLALIVETGEAREVHHFALLFGYGADLVAPYMAFDIIDSMVSDGSIEAGLNDARSNYMAAVEKGLLKVLSKMGISTLSSYKGAQIFEALGLGDEVVEKCFTGTSSRINGVGFDEIAQEALQRHSKAYAPYENAFFPHLPSGGLYQWKKDGERHLWNPESIAALQDAARNNDWERYKEFSGLINDQAPAPVTLRGLLKFKPVKDAINIEEVEPAEEIKKRIATGAMSYGSISRSAHEALAMAMNRIGGRSNTGEGGEDPRRFLPLPNGDSARSAIKQVASGRFGVTTNYLANADEIQIKIAQGAKPGEGGQLPGHKVSATIARTRYTTPGVTLISPPPHHDIYSIEDLAQLIFDLKNVNPAARISVKLVSEIGVGTVAAGVAKGHADMILISGGDGGTGASPMSSIRHAGLPWELGLAETHQTLVLNDLRSRVRLQTDGQMRTGKDMAIAAILGAEEFGFCTAALICLGCVMLRHCNLNNCSVGIATQDEHLERRFRGRVEHVVNYFDLVAKDLRHIMASIGVRSVNELIGRTDLVELDPEKLPPKAAGLDLSGLLEKSFISSGTSHFFTREQDHGLENVLDKKLIEVFSEAIVSGTPEEKAFVISNVDRATGAMLSGRICSEHGEEGLPEDTIRAQFDGVAGQSFGAFLAKGVTFTLSGLGNDYVGKGISGGRIVMVPPTGSDYEPGENVIMGNTAFYGAIAGEAFIKGVAGERFCVRNSGLYAVVEGVGDHGCEYMTGGRVVILGPTGRNFAAGMSGGIAYVYDPQGSFPKKCNTEMVELGDLETEDALLVRRLLDDHLRYTSSRAAGRVLDKFEKEKKNFVKVLPLEYKRVLSAMREVSGAGLMEVSDG